MIKKIGFIFLFFVLQTQGSSQSKKKTIVILQNRIDSLSMALSLSNQKLTKNNEFTLQLTKELSETKGQVQQKTEVLNRSIQEKQSLEFKIDQSRLTLSSCQNKIDSLNFEIKKLAGILQKYDCWHDVPKIDTFYFVNKTILSTEIDSVEFREAGWNSISTPININQKNILIHVTESSIKCNLRNGKSLTFKNNLTPGWETYHVYTTIYSSLDFIDYFLFFDQYYEGGEYFLVDKENGEIITLKDWPIVSNDIRYMACGSASQYGDFHGIQIFEITKNKKIRSLLKNNSGTWSPSNIKWNNKNELLIEKWNGCKATYENTNSQEYYKYSKINFLN